MSMAINDVWMIINIVQTVDQYLQGFLRGENVFFPIELPH